MLNESVLVHVSGLAPKKRLRSTLMALQAYIDDSMTDDAVLVLAGYIAPVENWLKFSEEWQELLDMQPRWSRFKMSEIASSPNPERFERAGWFARIIEEHAHAFVAVALELKPLREIVEELDLPNTFLNPYVTIYRMILDVTAQYQHELGITAPVDFIFDAHSQAKQVRMGFDIMKDHHDDELSARLGRMPRFDDDEEFLPLQAADMLAWHIRKHWIAHGTITNSAVKLSWPEKNPVPGFKVNVDRKTIKDNFLLLRQKLVDAGIINRVIMDVTFTGLDGKTF